MVCWCNKGLWMVKRRKDFSRSMLSMIEEPNTAQHHDDKLLTRPFTNDDIPKQQHHQWQRGFVNFAQKTRWICQVLFFFLSLWFFHTSRHTVVLQSVFWGSFDSQRSSVYQISDVFPMGHDPITHAHRARCPAVARHIFNECCHCHCHAVDCWLHRTKHSSESSQKV